MWHLSRQHTRPLAPVCRHERCYTWRIEHASRALMPAPQRYMAHTHRDLLRYVRHPLWHCSYIWHRIRIAFRSVAPDRLPLVGRMGENLYGAFAYGSRGLVWAALAAELLASELEGEPLPLEGKLADALSPLRFAQRALRRGAGIVGGGR